MSVPTDAPLTPHFADVPPPGLAARLANRLPPLAGHCRRGCRRAFAVACRRRASRALPMSCRRTGWGGVGRTGWGCRPAYAVAVPLVIMRGPMPLPPLPADGVGIGKPRRPYRGKPRATAGGRDRLESPALFFMSICLI